MWKTWVFNTFGLSKHFCYDHIETTLCIVGKLLFILQFCLLILVTYRCEAIAFSGISCTLIYFHFHQLYKAECINWFFFRFNASNRLISIITLMTHSSEQPIFTCQAHVFHIDPKTKRTWITASTKAVSVSFFYDSSRNLYRIISVEGSKAVINSTITPLMSFTQTSQKFGQWSDVRANTVYGLGFSSEAELTKFVEKFQEVKEATKSALAKTANGSSAATPITSA